MIISSDHPALAGHFPGEPIVPGVVLIEEVLKLAKREALAVGHLHLPSVKFHAPLRPGEEFVIRIDKQKFTVRRGDTLIASGSFAFA